MTQDLLPKLKFSKSTPLQEKNVKSFVLEFYFSVYLISIHTRMGRKSCGDVTATVNCKEKF